MIESHTATETKHLNAYIKKFNELTNDLYEIKIKWNTQKMRNLLRLKKSKNPQIRRNMYMYSLFILV